MANNPAVMDLPTNRPDNGGKQALFPDGGVENRAASSEGEPKDSGCQIEIQNLGGIADLSFEISAGVTLLAGENASNRSSLLQSIAAGLGGKESAAQLKTDSESGHVRLTLGGETYTRQYSRTAGATQVDGEPYREEAELVDTFISLFGDNPARRAVTHGGDLRELLMQPVDVDAIQRQIEEYRRRQSSLTDRIERIEQREKELPGLAEKKNTLEAELDSLESDIDGLRSNIQDLEAAEDDEGTDEVRDELETLREALTTAEQTRDELEQKIEFREEEQAELEEEQSELEAKRSDLTEPDRLETDIQSLESELDRLRERRRALEMAIEDLQTVVQINENLIEDGLESLGIVDDDDVTAALDPDSQTVECWTCGTSVERSQLTDRLDALRDIVAEHRQELNTVETRISERESEKQSLEKEKRTYERVENRLEELDDQRERHRERREELEAELDETTTEISSLEAELADVEAALEDREANESDDSDELAAAHQELTQLERERGRVQNRLSDVVQQIDEIESLSDERSTKEEELAEVRDDLADLRGRIEERERELVETLNAMMDDLVGVLQYRNISRVWVERLADEGQDASEFDLHIVREGSDGGVYEDTVETLSESEREVVGLVVALAGYLVHNLDEEIPFLLFDSVEMIDADRMAALLDYVTSRTATRYLVVAVLSKDADAIQESAAMPAHRRIESKAFQ